MGGTASKDAVGGPSYRPVVSRDKLLAMTQQPRELINEIFKVMVEKLTPKDILALSDPKVCPKYVFFMSDAIKQSFLQLRLRPLKDKQGVIYYASVEELQGKGKDPVLTDKEFNTHCLSVAFFYVRVFQIFGALALSVTDDVNAGRGFGARAIGVPRGQPRGAIGGPRPGAVRTGWFGFGGSMATDDFVEIFRKYSSPDLTDYINRNYSALAKYIRALDNTESKEAEDKFIFSFDTSNLIKLLIYIKTASQQQQYGYPGFGPIPVRGVTRANFSSFIVYESSTRDKDNKIILIRCKIRFLSTSNDKTTFKISEPERRSTSGNWEPITLSGSGIPISKEVIFNDPSSDPIKSLERYFEKILEFYIQKQTGAPGATGAIVPLTDPLATDFLMKAISAKQVSFGSARALQLLNIDALISDKVNPESRICYDDFKDLPEFINLPRGGQGLGSVPAFRAMEILFFNDLRVTPDNKFSLIPGSQQAYTDFLTKMKGAFGKTSTVAIDDKTRLDSIKMDVVACGADKKNKVLTVQKTAVKAVRGKVQNLLGIQGAHTSRVLQFILTNLIQVTKSGVGRSFVLHPRLFAGGLSEIDRVAKEAREMLLKHYVQCEEMYRTGVAVIPK